MSPKPSIVSVRVRALLLTCALGLLLAAMLAAAGTASAATRITEGRDVTAATYADRWRSIVSLQLPEGDSDTERHICGGTLISPRLVVTAAHCVFDEGLGFYVESAKLHVLTGTRTLDPDDVTEAGRYEVESIFVHPGYKPEIGFFDAPNLGNDIAVLRLAKPVAGGRFIPVVGAGETALWGGGGGLASGAHIAGWGLRVDPYTADDESDFMTPSHLQEAAIPMHDDALCERSSSQMGVDSDAYSRTTMLCTGKLDTLAGPGTNRVGACFGDSGGPLIVEDGAGGYRLVGVTSWGPNGCSAFSIYTRVPAFRTWIASIDDDRFGPAGIQPIRNVRQEVAGVHSVRIRWDHVGPTADRFRLFRRNFLRLRGDGFFSVGFNALSRAAAAATPELLEIGVLEGGAGRNARVLLLDDVEPRRLGERKFSYYAFDVVSIGGNHAPRQMVRVTAPVDMQRPTAPGRPRVIAWRNHQPKLWWLPAHDNDQIGRYVVQLRVSSTSEWRTWTGTNARCFLCFLGWGDFSAARIRRELTTYHHDMGAGNPPGLPANAVWLRHLRVGTSYQAQVIAIDRAGNRHTGPTGTFTVR